MNFSNKNVVVYGVVIVLALVSALGWSLALTRGNAVSAEEGETVVDGETLDSLYDAVFHRPADSEGRGFHLGRKLKDVLRDFRSSEEQRYYGALFKAVKSYEEAQRAPGTLTSEEKQSHLDLIDSALSGLVAWVATLPDQDPCRATIGPETARTAIKAAHDRLTAAGKTNAEHGLLNALRRIGKPDNIVVRSKCLRLTPTPTSTPTATPIQ